MRRRSLIKYAGASALLGATGCLSESNADPENKTGNKSGAEPTNPGGMEDRGIEITETEFTRVQTGMEQHEATVEFVRDEDAVFVKGVVIGDNGCYKARLGSAEYSGADDRLVVDVETFEDRDGGESCTEALINIGYEMSAGFDGGLPGTVDVFHNGERVTQARGSHTDAGGGIESTEFRVIGSTSTDGKDIDEAEIEFDEEGKQVVFEGTTRGSDGCKTAVLDSVEYDPSEDTVSLTVVTQNREDAGRRMCKQTLTEIDYVARVNFDGEIPQNASVSHNGRASIAASYESDTVSATPDSEP